MLAAVLLAAPAPVRAGEAVPEPSASPASAYPAAAVDPSVKGSGVTIQKCGGSASARGRIGHTTLDVTFTIDGAKTADAVEFTMRNEFGPRYAFGVRDTGNFAPGVAIRHVLGADAPADIAPFAAFPNHCSMTYVHFTDGTQWRAAGTFLVAERPEIVGEFGLPEKSGPRGLAVASDGSLWIVEETANKIAHVDPGNGKVIAEYAIPTPHADARYITRGAGDVMWFSEHRGANIGTIAPDGTIREFPIGCNGCHPGPIAVDKDGNAWFAEMNLDFDLSRPTVPPRYGPNVVGRVATNGTVSEFSVPTKDSYANAIFAAADGTIWFTESNGKIGHMAGDGKILVEIASTGEHYGWIGQGEDRTLHLISTDAKGASVGFVTLEQTPDGYRKTSKFSPLAGRVVLSDAAMDRAGNIWFTDMLGNRVARSSADGRAAELNLGTGKIGIGTVPTAIRAADDGTLWVLEVVTDRLVHIRPH